MYTEGVVCYCEWCGQEKILSPSKASKRDNVFCCKEHYWLWMSKYRVREKCYAYKGRSSEGHCDYCGKVMVISLLSRERGIKSFCSQKCKNLFHSSRMTKDGNSNWHGGKQLVLCGFCGKEFEVATSKANRLCFCSRECLIEWKIKEKIFAGENNPNWKGGVSLEQYGLDFNSHLKLQIRQRDDFTCQLCGAKENGRALDCHHIDYDKQNNSEINLISLCQENGCHQKTNGRRSYWTKYFQSLLTEKYGYLYYKPLRNGFRRLRT